MTQGTFIPPSGPPPLRAGGMPRRRCVRHEEREAVARCVVCEGGFCRECITEHEQRLYCAPCFARTVETRPAEAKRKGRGRGILLATASLLCLIVGFYLLGRILAAIPPDYHDGTVWKEEFAR